MEIRLGTRGSKLALAQAQQIQALLSKAYPMHCFTLHTIVTYGDQNTETPLHQMSTSGVFVKEIEKRLYAKEIDIAVHSMKDLPAQLSEGLCLADTILREDSRDVLISKHHKSLMELPSHAHIATGSKRRKAQLLKLRDDLIIEGIRGNIDTRLQLMQERNLDGIVVAAAAIHRLQKQDMIAMYFSQEDMVPAVCQGAIALEIREQDTELKAMLHTLSHEQIHQEIEVERHFLQLMNGGCHTPMGARCHITEQIELLCLYGNDDATLLEKKLFTAPLKDKEQIAISAAAYMKERFLHE